FAWGHPTENNCSFEQGRAALMNAINSANDEFLAHHREFENAVLREHFGYTPPDTLKVHDTKFQLFLTDPYAYSFGLKPSAERILGWAPDEQDDLKRWIVSNVPGATEKNFGAFICRAPGELVGRYARGDTDRTLALHEKLYPLIVDRGMVGAYEREQKLAPILSESSVRGVRIDRQRLSEDLIVYRAAQRIAETYIFGALGCEFELTKDAQLAAALDKAGMVTEWVLTPTGKRSVARKNLVGRVKDPILLQYLAYHGILETCLGTFAEPWLRMSAGDGRLHAEWNQVRGNPGEGGDMTGTRTGRMSCKEPNLTNIPNDFEGVVVPETIVRFIHEQSQLLKRNLYIIPHMRVYLLPEVGHVWLKRDFSAQEMRIMAHFAEGKLFEAFRKDPKTDPHVAVQKIILEFSGINLSRKYVKITGFGIMYGRGVPNLSAALGVAIEEGKRTRDAYFEALPEVKDLSDACRRMGRSGGSIRTWGGRLYPREPHPDRDLSYKLMNYLIQGSAADQTKEATIDWEESKTTTEAVLIADVHDEMNISAPADCKEAAMRDLRTAMNRDRFDVPFESEGYAGPNWADIEKYEP
ncbi:MAG TPA: DNA polymerase, partial [Anaerolineales bacterium]